MSGPAWCELWPTSTDIGELAEPFQGNVRKFLAALEAAAAADPGAEIRVQISATYRPPERAYLMHWSWGIARGFPANMCRPQDRPGKPINPASVPPMDDVEIDWTCSNNPELAKTNAEAMVRGYDMAFCASLKTLHEEREAIDMTIGTGPNVEAFYVNDAQGTSHQVCTLDDLRTVGATYGVMKLPLSQLPDRPHWSVSGH